MTSLKRTRPTRDEPGYGFKYGFSAFDRFGLYKFCLTEFGLDVTVTSRVVNALGYFADRGNQACLATQRSSVTFVKARS